ncbi:flagellin [Cupriavidus sp. UGS-1]|uniref:flagellin n=1 Tax=Cupriavidus sp. UGS-1 TaxID=2899826 RepID=UPI001E3ADBB4|nr:flagellin [Cupriavidus sp. UGS-1]MCD9121068.1 flagellin [Cupriavidus sp. UGS-1]
MYRQALTTRPARRGAARGAASSAAAAMLLGAGLACAGQAWGTQAARDGGLDAGLASHPAADPHHGAIAAARSGMAGWTPVASARLEELRGGFETGGLQVSFGIERAVYINGNLVVSTSLVIPDVSRITSEQAGRLAAALQSAANAGSVAANALGQAGQGTSTPGSGSASSSASAGQPGTATSTPGTATVAAPSPAPPSGATTMPAPAVIATATGSVTTNGLLNLIQNGPGNSFNAGALAGTPATVIQNSLNNQSIQSLLTIDAGVNTLQAFRAGVAGAALNSALQRAASMR